MEVIAGVVPCARCGLPYCPDCVVTLNGEPYDAACKEEMVRDLRSGSVVIEFTYASPWSRLRADLFDLFLCALPLLPFMVLTFRDDLLSKFDGPAHRNATVEWLRQFGLSPARLVAFVPFIHALYEGAFLSKSGQTPGKKRNGIQVVRADGSALTSLTAWTRAGLRFAISLVPFLGILDNLMVFSDRRRTLRDRVAGTLVVKKS